MEVTCIEIEEYGGEGGSYQSYMDPPTSQSMNHGSNSNGYGEHDPMSRSKESFIKLHTYQEAPPFMRGNPYITQGYRVYLPTSSCYKSMFVMTNETVNIWTHIIGFVYFALILLDDNIMTVPSSNGNLGDHLTFSIMDSCFMTCLLCSAGYHLFNCQSEMTSQRWFSMDLMGVSIGLIGCYFPGAYYAFYCHLSFQTIYMILLILAAFCSVAMQLHSGFLTPRWYWRRFALYSALALMGVVPMSHWVWLNGGPTADVVQLLVPRASVAYVFVVIGGVFYASKFPECVFPGRVNYFGSSHQWWHVMVLAAFLWTHHTTEFVFNFWQTARCEDFYVATL